MLFVIFILLVAAGAGLWAARTGRLPESVALRVSRWLTVSWWFEPQHGDHWAEPVLNDTLNREPSQDAPQEILRPANVEMRPSAMPRERPVPAVAQGVSSSPVAPLPVIGLDDVAAALTERRYRRHREPDDHATRDDLSLIHI